MGITIQQIQAKLVEQLSQTSDTASLDVQVILAHLLEKPRSWVMAHPEASITTTQYNNIRQAVDQLAIGEPLPYIIGHWEFYGLDFKLTPDVLIPRPETEILVERAINWLQRHPHKREAVDVGTGSGCIGISLAKHIPDLHIVLTDISDAALNVARLNAETHGLLDKIEFKKSYLLARIPGPFSLDLICANLPYIPSPVLETLPVAKKEPRLALDGGLNGTKLIKRLLKEAKGQLTPGGLLLLEFDPAQADHMVQLAQKNYPHSKVQIIKDLSGRDRCLEIELNYEIFHLCQRQDWLKGVIQGVYEPESLEIEGFIHCSEFKQIMEVANRYFKGVPDMVVLSIDPEKLNLEIRWEKTDHGWFPHIYGPVRLEAVDAVADIAPDSDGTYRHIYSRLD
jgi:release factor glutamine methyltransferase